LIGAPAAAGAQSTPLSRRVSVDLGLGTHYRDGGDVESMSAGFAITRIVTVAATIERGHIPTAVENYGNGSSVTRNGTVTWLGGELRLTIPAGERWTPYVVAGRGVGKSVLNVNEFFPNPITRTADLVYLGGGVRYALNQTTLLFADAKLALVIGREADDLSARLPIRAGVTFRF
jgi:hypothetical protein